MRERRGADVRLARGRRHVGDLRDGVGDPGRVAEPAGGEHLPTELDLEVGDDGEQVGVAGALAVAVDRALHVGGAGVDGREGVGHRTAGVVVAVDADADARGLDHVVHDVRHPGRQHAAVGVAQGDDRGARVVRRAQHLEGVVAVEPVPVEEVLGVEEHLLPLGPQVGDGVADHREVLLERGPQGELDVPLVGLGDQRHHARAALAQGRHQRVVGRAGTGAAGRPERRELGVLEVQLLLGAAEELGVLRVRARPAALDVADTQVVELLGDGELVGDGEVETLLLRAVAQGGVVHVEGALEVHARSISRMSGKQKDLSRTRGRRVGVPDALGDDDAVLRHEPIVPRVPGMRPDVSESGPQPPG